MTNPAQVTVLQGTRVYDVFSDVVESYMGTTRQLWIGRVSVNNGRKVLVKGKKEALQLLEI